MSSKGLVLPRQEAPHFSGKAVLHDTIFDISSEQYRGKWLVVFFYPYDYTFVCPTELVAFSSAKSEFAQLGAEVIAISCDSVHVHHAWTHVPVSEGGVGMLDIPLLSDHSKKISREFGVLVENENDELYGAALRALFVIDPKFIVRSVLINDEAVGRNVGETLRLIQAFKHVDEHGETCPANWTPGDATIQPTYKGSRAFFQKILSRKSSSS